MCNLYSITKGQKAICDLAGAMRDLTGKPADAARRVSRLLRSDRTHRGGRRARTRHGALGHAVADLRHRRQEDRSWRHQHPQRQIVHWRRWLGVESRCIVPFKAETLGGAATKSRIVEKRQETRVCHRPSSEGDHLCPRASASSKTFVYGNSTGQPALRAQASAIQHFCANASGLSGSRRGSNDVVRKRRAAGRQHDGSA